MFLKPTELLQSIINAGVQREVGLGNQYKRKSINGFALIVIILTLPFYFIYFSAGLYQPMQLLFGMHMLYLISIVFNYKGQYRIANYVFILSSDMCIFSMSYFLGFNSGFHLYLFVAPLYILWIYELNQVLDIAITMSIGFIFYGLIYFLKIHQIQIIAIEALPAVDFYTINIVLTYIILFLLFYSYTSYHRILRNNLIAKQEDLSESYKNLEQFSFIVSHNLRSPLSNIKGFLTLYDPQEVPTENDLVVQSVIESTEHLDNILTDLNVILDPKNPALQIQTNVLLSDLLREVKISLSEDIYKNNVEIIEKFDPLFSLNTVRTMLNSVLFNLVQNAIKYKRGDQVQLIISAMQNETDTEIRVQDNGIGIDLERYNDRVFKLYSRFNVTQKGKGIGLYLVKANVESLGGTIQLESQVDVGSTFIIHFKK